MIARQMTRRNRERYEVWLPVKVNALREGIAATHDASSRGILMVTASTLEAGSPIDVSIKLPGAAMFRRVSGRVVRVEENPEDPHGLWPHRVAVEFDQAQPDLEEIIGSLPAPDRRTRER